MSREPLSLDQLVYLEKLGLVVLTWAAIAYLVLRTLHKGPVRAVTEIAGGVHL